MILTKMELLFSEYTMPEVAIVTDSTASIPDSIIQSLNIHWVPYYVHRGVEVLRDLVSVQREAFYKWMPSARELPTTASPGPGDYVTMYQNLYDQGARQIVSIHMTSKGSGAYQAAMAAKTMLQEQQSSVPDLIVEVVDTLNVSMCHGWMVIEAARATLEGKSLNDIVDRIKKMIPITRMIQTADTLRYLYLGGRIGRAKHLLGSLLNIKPLIGMEDGVIVALGQARSRGEAYRRIVEMVEKTVGARAKIKVAIVHAAASEEARKLKDMLQERLELCSTTIVESLIAELSPALGVHSGPGTVGLCYYPVIEGG
jgi:DegV family protein with EDD domain